MFDIGGWEFGFILILLLLVVGPKELPGVLRTMGRMARKVRGLNAEFQRHVDDMIREADLEDVSRDIGNLRRGGLGENIRRTVDPDGALAREAAMPGRYVYPEDVNPTGGALPDPPEDPAPKPTP